MEIQKNRSSPHSKEREYRPPRPVYSLETDEALSDEQIRAWEKHFADVFGGSADLIVLAPHMRLLRIR